MFNQMLPWLVAAVLAGVILGAGLGAVVTSGILKHHYQHMLGYQGDQQALGSSIPAEPLDYPTATYPRNRYIR
jgi:hypothetical protein